MVAMASPDVMLLLMLLLLGFAGGRAGTAAAATDSSPICDTAECGKGTCSEVPGIIPEVTTSYKCTCDPGWSQPKLLNLTVLPFMPCIVPNCTFSSACFNPTVPMRSIPLTDPCALVNCGQGGDCEKGAGSSYQCRCQPGLRNMFNLTSMPCIGGNCTFGADCARLGLDYPLPWNPTSRLLLVTAI
ncbi:neurogenic locus notch homolog protein 3 [Zea mays]|uniref:neurogenic locus notch homolog protein 3 n=1 Tax=Zea mays TaxID=4577 RepID=UPI0009AADBB8|nr:neurogenic locus notch homolog protein 3 [Zea mays]|eukprot:XP_020399261.1 neurogenic locus notch homolog protein 3 [Zea mays]